ncbi:unnamed protein product [Chrysodeixis includens]|uniref:Uncharacterized protein n=1 Tax=Chrysodeixis includens TaxID=689277 RepID=A0A9P0FSE1_CHRIL|nr:unnamed protein product [Chrysodeixis includens]
MHPYGHANTQLHPPADNHMNTHNQPNITNDTLDDFICRQAKNYIDLLVSDRGSEAWQIVAVFALGPDLPILNLQSLAPQYMHPEAIIAKQRLEAVQNDPRNRDRDVSYYRISFFKQIIIQAEALIRAQTALNQQAQINLAQSKSLAELHDKMIKRFLGSGPPPNYPICNDGAPYYQYHSRQVPTYPYLNTPFAPHIYGWNHYVPATRCPPQNPYYARGPAILRRLPTIPEIPMAENPPQPDIMTRQAMPAPFPADCLQCRMAASNYFPPPARSLMTPVPQVTTTPQFATQYHLPENNEPQVIKEVIEDTVEVEVVDEEPSKKIAKIEKISPPICPPRPPRPKAPINFAPPPPTTVIDLRTENMPFYFSEVTKGMKPRIISEGAKGIKPCIISKDVKAIKPRIISEEATGIKPRFISEEAKAIKPRVISADAKGARPRVLSEDAKGIRPRVNSEVTKTEPPPNTKKITQEIKIPDEEIPEASATLRGDPWPNRYVIFPTNGQGKRPSSRKEDHSDLYVRSDSPTNRYGSVGKRKKSEDNNICIQLFNLW